MITDRDIEKLKMVFVTKDELKDSLERTENRMVEMTTSVGNVIIKEIKEEIKELREDVNSILENHERRIEKLELKITPS